MSIEQALDRFIDAMGRVTNARVLMDQALADERNAQPRCGNCYHWMKKRSCPREARGEKPSCGAVACKSYQEDARVQSLRDRAAGYREQAEAALADLGQKS